MKNIFNAIVFLFFYFSFGQEKTATKQEIQQAESYSVSEKDTVLIKPEPYEGFKMFYSNLQKSIQIPNNEVSGIYKAKVSFIVNTDGTLSDYKIIQETPLSIGLGEEVIRVLKTFPKWKTSPKKTFYMLPVTIVLESSEPSQKKD